MLTSFRNRLTKNKMLILEGCRAKSEVHVTHRPESMTTLGIGPCGLELALLHLF